MNEFRKKIAKAFIWIAIYFAFLELFLRLGGWVFIVRQEIGNRELVRGKKVYTIMCVGESTTALGGKNSYPRQLEEILNSQNKGIQFSVINKGVPAVTTAQILARIESYLNDYQPRVVVAMMGINDSMRDLSADENSTVISRIVSNLQVFKLGRRLVQNLENKTVEAEDHRRQEKLRQLEASVDKDPSAKNFIALINICRAANNPQREAAVTQKAIAAYPSHHEIWALYGMYFQRRGEHSEAVQAYSRSLRLNPGHRPHAAKVLSYLGECYQLQGNDEMAQASFLKAISDFPNHPEAYGLLGSVYFGQGKYDEAQKLFEKQISVNPQAAQFYGPLNYCYRKSGAYDKAIELLERAVAVNPQDLSLYIELGSSLMDAKDCARAEEIFKKARALNSENAKGINGEIDQYLLECYRAQSKKDMAEELKESMETRQRNVNQETLRHYEGLYDILAKKKIQLVAVQYPLRDARPLKKIPQSQGRIIFVDNESIFREAVKREGFDAYFYDRFAGDFGHCTPKGNHLLANNIAQAILKNISP